MYLALYRKWRPRFFSDVCGQDCITDILKEEIKQNTVSHAYLFCGLRGTGKTTCAKILAKAVNCLNPKDGEPCGECENCKDADRGALLDITEIDAASNNGVDNIRSVIEEVSFLPSQGKRKVYIIDEVHMLSAGAFNALLKTLEEPPEHVLFILCTTETHKIPATILSRCQRFDFGRIESEDIVKRIKYIASSEGMEIDDGAAKLIARLSEGAMRDALSLLELCVGNKKTDYELACRLMGVPDRENFHRLCDMFASHDTAGALDLINGMLRTGKASAICSELIEFFRDLIIVGATPHPEKVLTELPDEIERCKATAAKFTRSGLLYSADILEHCLITLPQPNVNATSTVEMAIIKLCNIEKTVDVEALFARVEALEKGMTSAPRTKTADIPPELPETAAKEANEANEANEAKAKAENVTVKKKEKEIKTEQTEKAAPSIEKKTAASGSPEAFERWEEFADAVSLEDKVAGSFVRMGRGFVNGDTLEILTEDSMSATMLNKPARLEVLKKAAAGVIGHPVDVTVTMKKTQKDSAGLLD